MCGGRAEEPPEAELSRLWQRCRELSAVGDEFRRLKDDLQRSEETIRNLIEQYCEGVVLVGPDGLIRMWNPAMAAITGIPRGEAIGRPLWDVQCRLVPEEERGSGVHENLEHMIRGMLSMDDVRWFGTPWEREVLRPDGTRRLIETVWFPTTMEGGTSLGGIARDITARHEVERRIADVARLVAEAPNPVMRAASEGRLLYANEASLPFLEAWGCAAGQPLPEEWAQRVREVLAQAEPTVTEVAIGDHVYAVMLTPVPAHGEVNLYAMDVTARRRAEEALRQTAEHFRRAFEQAPIGLALVEPSGDLVQVNRAMLDLVGYAWDDLALLQWHDLVHPDDARHERQLVERVVAGETDSYRVEERLVASDGSVRWAIVDGALLRTVASEPMYLVVQVQDITERRLAEELTLRVAIAARVEEAEERERRRVAQELHDRVGQELSALGISLSLLRAQLVRTLAPDTEARLEDALALVRQITASVRDVMAELRPPMLDDYGLLAALRWYAMQFAARVNVAVYVVGREPLPRLPSNVAIMLFRIAQEALSNVARHALASRVDIRLTQRSGIMRLMVADNGRGFDPDATAEMTPQGGWGLRTMAERAAAIGARLRIESRLGVGTRVVVELPREVGARTP